jgi:hypothetical protein
MNAEIPFKIAELAVSLGKGSDATVAGTLLKIIHVAWQAHEDHTGEPLDPALIKPKKSSSRRCLERVTSLRKFVTLTLPSL